MYAVVKTGGKQYRVSQGSKVVVDRVAADAGASIELAEVLMLGGEKAVVGTPTVPGAKVTATVVAHEQGDKTEYVRYTHRQRRRTQKNGRAKLSVLEITAITGA
jgi:large subunit ribosomal protein L21